MKRHRRGEVFLTLTAIAFLMLGSRGTQAAKPAPLPPPPGTVYYIGLYNAVHGMNADGSGKFQALPTGYGGMPSSRLYGADRHRWWIGKMTVAGSTDFEQVELFAFRPDWVGGVIQVQLTNVGRQSIDDDQFISLGYIAIQGQGWSNDKLDSFVSIEGESVRWDANLGRYVLDNKHILRVWLTGAEIEIADQSGIDPMLPAGDPRVEIVLPTTDLSLSNYHTHHWSPDGNTLASLFLWNDAERLVLTDLTTLATWNPCDGGARDFRLSPVGRKIAIGGGSIATLDYDGANYRTVADSRGFLRNPCWSPDGTQMVYSEHLMNAFSDKYAIYRIPAEGGTKVLLTKDLDSSVGTYPIAWVTNDLAP